MIALCGCITDEQKREVKEHGSFAFPVACYLNGNETLPVPWHWHEEIEVLVIEQGSAVVRFSSEQYEVTEGNGCFINYGILHMVEKASDVPMKERCMVFHPRLVGGSMESVFWQKYVKPVISDPAFSGLFLNRSIPWQQTMISHIRRAWEVCVKEEELYEIAARNELSECIGMIQRNRPLSSNMYSEKFLRQNARMKIMLKYMQQHFDQTITIRQIAESASVSESECMRCFRQTIGVTPIAYLKNYRLQCAAEFLKTTDAPITVIGSQCGFQEMSYFTRSFRQMYGCTPSQYRKDTVGSES